MAFDPDAYLASKQQSVPEQPGLLSRGLEYINSRTTAPGRAALSAAQTGDITKPGEYLKGIGEAAYNQFGKPSETAPSPGQLVNQAFPNLSDKPIFPHGLINKAAGLTPMGMLAQKAGLVTPETNVSPKEALTAAYGPITDVTNYIPAEKVIGPAAKGIGMAAEAAEPYAKAAIKPIGEAAYQGFLKGSEMLSGVPKKVIDTMVTKYDDVKQLIKDNAGSMADLANDTKDKILGHIQTGRKEINAQVGAALEQSNPDKNIPIDSIINKLESEKQKLRTHYNKSDISGLDDIINTIKNENPSGLMSTKDLFDATEYLRDSAKPSFTKNGAIFARGDKEARAAKSAWADARQALYDREPNIKEAYGKLSEIHDLEDQMGRNFLAEGKPSGKLMAAGSGDTKEREILDRLGEITGKDLTGEAEKFAAAQTFADPKLVTTDFSGKGTERLAKGSMLGGAAGGVAGGLVGHPVQGAAIGGMLGGAITSPAALKAAIDAGQIGKKAIGAVGGLARDAGSAAIDAAQSDKARLALAAIKNRLINKKEDQTKEKRGFASDGK